MKPLMTLTLAAVGLLMGLAPTARAQAPFGRPPTSPFGGAPISPYLNLLRGGNPAINYYGLVRPQQDFAASILQNQAAIAGQSALVQGALQGEPITGHPSTFMNFSHYYNGRIAGPATLRPAVSAPAVLPPAIAPSATLGVAPVRR
jgi:hypothetical protein